MKEYRNEDKQFRELLEKLKQDFMAIKKTKAASASEEFLDFVSTELYKDEDQEEEQDAENTVHPVPEQ